MKHRKLILVSAVLAGVMTLGGVAALAAVYSTSPTLSLAVTKSTYQRRIIGDGYYDYAQTPRNNGACEGRRGKTVTLYRGQIELGSTTSKYLGKYHVVSAKLPGGQYVVHTFVPGRVNSHYGNTLICDDARSTNKHITLSPPH